MGDPVNVELVSFAISELNEKGLLEKGKSTVLYGFKGAIETRDSKEGRIYVVGCSADCVLDCGTKSCRRSNRGSMCK